MLVITLQNSMALNFLRVILFPQNVNKINTINANVIQLDYLPRVDGYDFFFQLYKSRQHNIFNYNVKMNIKENLCHMHDCQMCYWW